MKIAPVVSLPLFCLALYLSIANSCDGQVQAIKRAAKYADELLEWVAKAAPKVSKRSDEGISVLEQTLRRMAAVGDDLDPSVVRFLKKNFDSLPMHLLADDTLLRLASKRAEIAEDVLSTAARLNLPQVGSRLELLLNECPQIGRQLVGKMAMNLPEDEGRYLIRGISGRELSNKQVQLVVDALREEVGGPGAGEVFELICRKQIAGGAMKPGISIKQGTQVLDGKYNRIHGLDGVGVDETGVPIVFEFTIDRQKDLAKTKQLSPEGVADSWNKLVAIPEKAGKLKAMGISDKFLRPIDDGIAKSLNRKLIASSDECLSESNRIAADLGINDLLVLGR